MIATLRLFTTVLSLAILAAGGYLLWSWAQGAWARDATGDLVRVREDWRLGTALALLAWSFLGGRVLPWLVARRDERPLAPERGQGRTIEGASGSALYVESHGRTGGPPIIFTHGWGMDSTFWSYIRQDLADRFHLVFWDLPGLGRSTTGREVSLSAFAADLATLIEVTGRRPVVLVGHSIGGMIIQTLVKERPDLHGRIAGVVLLNTTYTNPLRTMILSRLALALQKPLLEPAMRLAIWLQPLVWLLNWQSYLGGSTHLALRLGFGRYVTRSQLEHVTRLAVRNPPAVQARGDLAMLRWDATGALGRLRAPVLVVGGDLDIVTKLEANRLIAEGAPGAELRVVEGVNHLGPLERADAYNRLIADFALRAQPSVTADMPRPQEGRSAEAPDTAAEPRPRGPSGPAPYARG